MIRPLVRPFPISVFLIVGFFAGCAYFTPKDVPPPLPPIQETKPPLLMKGDYFRTFPWESLPKPRKDGNDPDTMTYTVKEGDTIEDVAEKMMGNSALGTGLADFNELSPPLKVSPGEKLVIPYPIIGISSTVLIKPNKEKEFGKPEPLDVEFKKGDRFKLRFEPNVSGYCYVFLQGPRRTTMLFPAAIEETPKKKPKKKGKKKEPAGPVKRGSALVKAFAPIEIPGDGKRSFQYLPKMAGDRVFVFLSLRKIAELEDLKEKPTIEVQDLEDVTHRVREGAVYQAEPPIALLRINDPSEVLAQSLNIKGE